jgi:hypothetical protein
MALVWTPIAELGLDKVLTEKYSIVSEYFPSIVLESAEHYLGQFIFPVLAPDAKPLASWLLLLHTTEPHLFNALSGIPYIDDSRLHHKPRPAERGIKA